MGWNCRVVWECRLTNRHRDKTTDLVAKWLHLLEPDLHPTSAGLSIVRFDAKKIPKGSEIRKALGIIYI